MFDDLIAIMGENRRAVIARELTKKFEEHIGNNIKDVIKFFDGKEIIGETSAEAAKRELLEETGVTVDQLLLVDVVDTIIPDVEGKIKYHYTLVDYMGLWQSGEPNPGDDAQEVRWVCLNELSLFSLMEKTIKIIQKALAMKT